MLERAHRNSSAGRQRMADKYAPPQKTLFAKAYVGDLRGRCQG